MYDLTCSIVVYHSPLDDLQKAINSFLHFGGHVRLYIIDNSGNDKLRFSLRHPQIEYIFPGKNLGYGKAHNLAIRKVLGKSKYHLVLNPDVEFDSSILDSLSQFMEQRPSIGLVMPKVLYRNGEMQHLCKMLPAPFDLFLRRFLPGPLKIPFRRRMERYELKHIDYNKTMQIPNLSGCFMFLRTEALAQVGAFDERFFMYLEDTDLCRRINSYYQTIYYPVVSIVHGYSKASYKSLRLLCHHLTSSILYFNKWGWLLDQQRSVINNSVLTFRYLPKLSLENTTRQTEQDSPKTILRVMERQPIANSI
jgi:GT2 family glycosyltransferase